MNSWLAPSLVIPDDAASVEITVRVTKPFIIADLRGNNEQSYEGALWEGWHLTVPRRIL